ncbi:MAG: hypothetical protein AAF357_00975, partial [Verrucomicrobiota bacterium]
MVPEPACHHPFRPWPRAAISNLGTKRRFSSCVQRLRERGIDFQDLIVAEVLGGSRCWIEAAGHSLPKEITRIRLDHAHQLVPEIVIFVKQLTWWSNS